MGTNNNLSEQEIASLTYSDPIAYTSFQDYLKLIGEETVNEAREKMRSLRFFPVYYNDTANVMYLLYSMPDKLQEIRNFHQDHLHIPIKYIRVPDTTLNSFIIHFLSETVPVTTTLEVEVLPDYQKPEIVKLKEALINEAIDMHASDIHVEIHGAKGVVLYRVNGILRPHYEERRERIISLIRSFINDAKLDTIDLVKPQNGSMQHFYMGKIYPIRLNVIGTFSGGYNENPTAVLRILYQDVERKMESLGFEQEQLELFKKMADREGIIIVTGPTGSGKTTTLYALLDWFNTEGKKVVSIEDPPEIIKENMVQISVQPQRGITWETALQNMMRMDPDIILIGEIRDRFAAEAAMQAAITGHTVLTTMHTQNVETVVERFRQLAGEESDVVNPHTIAYHLVGMVSQRLVTKIRIARLTFYDELVRQNPDLLKKLYNFDIGIRGAESRFPPEKIRFWLEDPLKLPDTTVTNETTYKGYDMTPNGRTVIAEVVYNDADLSEVIKQGEPKVIREYLNSLDNHLTLIDHAILKVQRGEISIEDVLHRI